DRLAAADAPRDAERVVIEAAHRRERPAAHATDDERGPRRDEREAQAQIHHRLSARVLVDQLGEAVHRPALADVALVQDGARLHLELLLEGLAVVLAADRDARRQLPDEATDEAQVRAVRDEDRRARVDAL